MQTATNQNFRSIIKDGPVLVDFWAPWCGPCVDMGQVLEEYDGMPIAKLNIDDYPGLATEYGVSAIPTMKVFVGGRVVHTVVGSRPLSSLRDELNGFTA